MPSPATLIMYFLCYCAIYHVPYMYYSVIVQRHFARHLETFFYLVTKDRYHSVATLEIKISKVRCKTGMYHRHSFF